MRWAVGLIIGVILGFLLGGIQPRRQLQDREVQMKALRSELAAAGKRSGRNSILPLPDLGVSAPKASSRRHEPSSDAEEPEVEADDAATSADGPDDAPTAEPVAPPSPPTREEQLKEFDMAVDAQRVRARQSRAALQEQAGLSDEEMAEFDDIVGQMNDDLAVYGDDVLRWSQEEPDTRDALGVAHEVTGILYESQSALEELVGDDALDDVEEPSRQIWNYVDLDTFRPAVESALDRESSQGRP